MNIIEHGIEIYRQTGMAKLLAERSAAFRRANILERQKVSSALNVLASDPEMQDLFRDQITAMRTTSEEAVRGLKDLPPLTLQSFGILDTDGMQLLVPIEYAQGGYEGLVKVLFEGVEKAVSVMGKPRIAEKGGFVYITSPDKDDSHQGMTARLRYTQKELVEARISHVVTITYGPLYQEQSEKKERKPHEKKPRHKDAYNDVRSALSSKEGTTAGDIATLTDFSTTYIYSILNRMVGSGDARMEEGERREGKRNKEASRYFLVEKKPDSVNTYPIDFSAFRVNNRPLDPQVGMVLLHYDGLPKGGGATERELTSRYNRGFGIALSEGYVKKNGDTFVLTDKGAATRNILPAVKSS